MLPTQLAGDEVNELGLENVAKWPTPENSGKTGIAGVYDDKHVSVNEILCGLTV